MHGCEVAETVLNTFEYLELWIPYSCHVIPCRTKKNKVYLNPKCYIHHTIPSYYPYWWCDLRQLPHKTEETSGDHGQKCYNFGLWLELFATDGEAGSASTRDSEAWLTSGLDLHQHLSCMHHYKENMYVHTREYVDMVPTYVNCSEYIRTHNIHLCTSYIHRITRSTYYYFSNSSTHNYLPCTYN